MQSIRGGLGNRSPLLLRASTHINKMKVGLLSRCCGMNATMVGLTKHPEEFKDVRAIVVPQPISLSSFYRTILDQMGMPDALPDVAEATRRATSINLKDMPPYAKAVNIPTLLLQVRDDALTTPADVQAIFDNLATKDKAPIWIAGTNKRFCGYTYLPKNPRPMLNCFQRFLV